MMSTPRPSSTSLLRYAAVAILFVTVSTCTLQVLAAVDQLGKPDAPGPAFAGFIPPLLSLLVGIGLAAIIDGLARMIERDPEAHADDQAAAVHDLTQAVLELRGIVQATAPRAAPPAAPVVIPANTTGDRHLQRVVQLLEELKDLTRAKPSAATAAPVAGSSQPVAEPPAPTPATTEPVVESTHAEPPPAEQEEMTTPAAPSSEDVVEHERPLIAAAAELVDEPPAPPEAEPESIEEHAPEPEPLELEPEPEAEPEPVAARVAEPDVEALDLEQAAKQVDDLMSLNDYDAALLIASGFAERYPNNDEGNALVKRVAAESETFRERTSAKLFEEIRSHVERRQWRRALEVAQDLLGKFPAHPRSAKIRQQLRPIQHNAEIEERQLLESRINESIKNQRYADAVELSEDLLRRFPNSPQAASLNQSLPKLRQRAAREMRETAGSGAFAG